MKIAIIGGGLTGISAAKLFTENKIDFSLFEASDALGGRVRSDNIDGFIIDRGFQIILDSYQNLKSLININDLEPCYFESGAMIGSIKNILANPIKNPKYILNNFLSSSATLLDKITLLRLITNSFFSENIGKNSDQRKEISAQKFLNSYGFSDKFLNDFFVPFFGGVFLDWNLSVSSRLFEFTFRNFLFGNAFLPKNGMQALPQLISKNVDLNNIFLKTKIISIEKNNNKYCVIDSSNNSCEFDFVIIATEHSSSIELIKNYAINSTVEMLSNLKTLSTTCLHYKTKTSPYNEPLLYLNQNKEQLFAHLTPITNINPNYSTSKDCLVSVTVKNSDEYALDQLDSILRSELKNHFGEQINGWDLIDIKKVNYALPYMTKSNLSPWSRTKEVYEKIYIGGDYTETPSIDGAIKAGVTIASHIIDRVNQ
jgi:protoporphyrinogen oxidase